MEQASSPYRWQKQHAQSEQHVRYCQSKLEAAQKKVKACEEQLGQAKGEVAERQSHADMAEQVKAQVFREFCEQESTEDVPKQHKRPDHLGLLADAVQAIKLEPQELIRKLGVETKGEDGDKYQAAVKAVLEGMLRLASEAKSKEQPAKRPKATEAGVSQ